MSSIQNPNNHQQQSAYSYEELISCGKGNMFGEGNAKLPLPPMLMFDQIVNIQSTGGKYAKGSIVADMKITESCWFFDCHFTRDPVMPGCLGLDAMWQLIGFFLAWGGGLGKGRALGGGDIKFFGEVTPDISNIVYQIDIKRVMRRKITVGIGDGILMADNKMIYSASDLRVGLFQEQLGFSS